MNEGIGTNQKMSEQPKLLAILSYQHELDDRLISKIKDLHELNNRLDGLANRINGADYPKNVPKEVANKTDGSSLVPLADKPDGIVGEMIAVNERCNNRINEFQSVISQIFVAINYLETHI